jgi:hypothetical protein
LIDPFFLFMQPVVSRWRQIIYSLDTKIGLPSGSHTFDYGSISLLFQREARYRCEAVPQRAGIS